MQTTPTRPLYLGAIERVLKTLATIIVGLLAAGLLIETIRFVIFSGEGVPHGGTIMGLFDMDYEDSIPTWFQGIHLAFAALLALVWGRDEPRRLRWGWWSLGALFLLMSLDELASLHEELGGPLARLIGLVNLPWSLSWVFVTLPAAVLFALVIIPFLRRLPASTALRLIAAGAVFVTGAAGMEMVGGAIAEGAGQANYPYRLVMITEETLEMIGTLLAIRALLLHFQPDHSTPLSTRDVSSQA